MPLSQYKYIYKTCGCEIILALQCFGMNDHDIAIPVPFSLRCPNTFTLIRSPRLRARLRLLSRVSACCPCHV